MDKLIEFLSVCNVKINNFVWGPIMLVLLVGTGIYITCGTRFFQVTKIRLWIRETFLAIFKTDGVHDKSDPKTISQFQSFTTALAGTVGTGNIVGVATALVAGGPGAIFWMWVSAFFGMMTKYAENVLGILFRYKNEKDEWVGGPMIYIERGLHCRWLAVLFALFAMFASFGIGNMTQANGIAAAIYTSFNVPTWVVGIVIATIVGITVLGGIKRIGAVTEKLVPFMALMYILGGIAILIMNFKGIPAAFAAIIEGAFSFEAALGGAGGYIIMQAMRFGVARGVFSNEAGLGSSVMVHSASNVKEPVKQGMWGVFEVFVDTIIVCSITALCILSTGALQTGAEGAALAMAAFSHGFGKFGSIFITFAITLFAFSTILGWSYYGERTAAYLFGPKAVLVYRIVYVMMSAVGCVASLGLVWSISDTFNGLMAIPNLIGVVLLSRFVFRATKDFLARRAEGQTVDIARTAADFKD